MMIDEAIFWLLVDRLSLLLGSKLNRENVLFGILIDNTPDAINGIDSLDILITLNAKSLYGKIQCFTKREDCVEDASSSFTILR